jgi:hypothetical protein
MYKIHKEKRFYWSTEDELMMVNEIDEQKTGDH